MNYMVVQQHHQNVQIRSKNLMLKQILVTSGVNVSLHIPDVTFIPYLINISTSSTSDIPHPTTFEHLHRHFLHKKDWKNGLVPYKKYLMSLITSVISNIQSRRPKLIQIFLFWFEEYVISLYNEFKLERISGSEKKERPYIVKTNVHNLNDTARGILLSCDNMPDKKPEYPTDIWAWKNLLNSWPTRQLINCFRHQWRRVW